MVEFFWRGTWWTHMAAAALSALLLSVTASAHVIGHSESAEPLNKERVMHAVLPEAQRKLWIGYLDRSEAAMRSDRDALNTERKGMQSPPPLPSSSPGARSMPLNREAIWYGSHEARHIADVILSFQIPSGGWGKNIDMAGEPRLPGQSYVSNNENRYPSPEDMDQPRDPAWHYVGTLDNDATVTQMRFLGKVQSSLPGNEGEPYRASFRRGVQYLLWAQFPNGGWPQVWPLEGGYHDAITYNDDAVRNVVELLQEIAKGEESFAFVPQSLRDESGKAASRAVDCILRTQVVLHGRRTIWGQQHDPFTLSPTSARNFEPASLASEESAGLLMLLMQQRPSTKALRGSVRDGVAWLRSHAIRDKAFVGGRQTPEGRHLVEERGAGPIWSRYYSLQTELPIFGDRDKTIHDDVNEISVERRNGYAWFNDRPNKVIHASIP